MVTDLNFAQVVLKNDFAWWLPSSWYLHCYFCPTIADFFLLTKHNGVFFCSPRSFLQTLYVWRSQGGLVSNLCSVSEVCFVYIMPYCSAYRVQVIAPPLSALFPYSVTRQPFRYFGPLQDTVVHWFNYDIIFFNAPFTLDKAKRNDLIPSVLAHFCRPFLKILCDLNPIVVEIDSQFSQLFIFFPTPSRSHPDVRHFQICYQSWNLEYRKMKFCSSSTELATAAEVGCEPAIRGAVLNLYDTHELADRSCQWSSAGVANWSTHVDDTSWTSWHSDFFHFFFFSFSVLQTDHVDGFGDWLSRWFLFPDDPIAFKISVSVSYVVMWWLLHDLSISSHRLQSLKKRLVFPTSPSYQQLHGCITATDRKGLPFVLSPI